MGKKDTKNKDIKNKETKNYIEHLAYDSDKNYSSTPSSDDEYREKYKKKYKRLKKLEENMNKAIDELNASKKQYDDLVIELKEKREQLNRILDLTNTVHKKSQEFLDIQEQIITNNVDTTTLLSNDE